MISAYRFFSVSSRLLHVLGAALAVCFGVIMVCGCAGGRGKATDAALASAEELMEERPDSALAVLCAIDSTAIDNAGRRALHGLLMAEARYKNFIDETDDSIIAASAAYFGRKGDDRRLMRARFIQAKIQFNNSDYTHSIVSALKAEKLAKQDSDNLYLARIYEHISDIYNRSYNIKGQLPYIRKAIEYYKKSDKSRNVAFSTLDFAIALSNLEQNEQSIVLTDSVLNGVSPEDTALLKYAYQNRMRACIDLGQIDSINRTFPILQSLCNGCFEDDYFIPFDFAIANKNAMMAKMYLDSIINASEKAYDPGYKERAYVDYYKMTGDNKLALEHCKVLMRIQYQEVMDRLNQSVMQSQRDYYNDEQNAANKKAAVYKDWFVLCLILLFASTVAFVAYHRYRLKIKQLEINIKIEEAGRLLATIQGKNQDLENMNNSIANTNKCVDELTNVILRKDMALSELGQRVNELYRNQFRVLNSLCNEYYEKSNASEKIRKTLYKDFEAEILALRDSDNYKQLEQSLDEYCDNLATKLREALPDLKRTDRKFLLLIFAGLSSKAICLICNIEYSNYYAKRMRLKNKIQQLDSEERDLFLYWMH